MTTPKEFDLKSMDITEDQLRKLKQALPEIFTEGLKVDFDRLRQTLGDAVDTDTERFGMQWPGKSECFKNNDQLKTNAVQIMKSHGVEDFRTV
ncbi:MAG: hypothetical protein JW808_09125 [Victivallales bacterium]|nr:hypothetical protein [Victivallales bacterium]